MSAVQWCELRRVRASPTVRGPAHALRRVIATQSRRGSRRKPTKSLPGRRARPLALVVEPTKLVDVEGVVVELGVGGRGESPAIALDRVDEHGGHAANVLASADDLAQVAQARARNRWPEPRDGSGDKKRLVGQTSRQEGARYTRVCRRSSRRTHPAWRGARHEGRHRAR